MASTPSNSHSSNHSDRVAGSRGHSPFMGNRTGPFTTVSTTAGGLQQAVMQNSFNNSFIIRMVVKGVSTRFPKLDVHLPIMLDLLHDMWVVLPYLIHDRFQITMFHCMLTLEYHGLLCPGEIMYSPLPHD